jgi:MFS family permease
VLLSVILPVYAKTIYGSPTSLGLALGAFGAGALTGSLVFGAIGRGWPRRLTFLSCWVLGPLVIFGFLNRSLRQMDSRPTTDAAPP